MGVLWVKLFTDLQIWGCKLHKNVFCGSLRHPSRYKGKGERVGKVEGGLDLDI